MPTSKKAAADAQRERTAAAAPTAAYEAALVTYAEAMEALRKGDFEAAKSRFEKVQRETPDEPELIERARTYALICERRLSPPAVESSDPDERYNRAVLLSNNGRWDEAVFVLDGLLHENPTSVRALYARASAWALKGETSRVVVDLRQAIAVEPKIRFQAVNDPDFERVREEPAFIDIIEPTPSGS